MIIRGGGAFSISSKKHKIVKFLKSTKNCDGQVKLQKSCNGQVKSKKKSNGQVHKLQKVWNDKSTNFCQIFDQIRVDRFGTKPSHSVHKKLKTDYVKLKAIPIFRRNCSKWFLFFIELSSKGDRKKFKGISYLEYKVSSSLLIP